MISVSNQNKLLREFLKVIVEGPYVLYGSQVAIPYTRRNNRRTGFYTKKRVAEN
jgi:hypothetical protein